MTQYEWGAAVLIGLVAVLYLLPTFIALGRGSPRTGFVALVNIFMGWTFVGWFWSLGMALW